MCLILSTSGYVWQLCLTKLRANMSSFLTSISLYSFIFSFQFRVVSQIYMTHFMIDWPSRAITLIGFFGSECFFSGFRFRACASPISFKQWLYHHSQSICATVHSFWIHNLIAQTHPQDDLLGSVFFFLLDCNEESCYSFNNACTFSNCNSSFGSERWVLLIADDIAFVVIHWSIGDVPFIWTTSRFHNLSTFEYLSSPFSISGQYISNPFLYFFVAFLSHCQTVAFAFVFDMNTSVQFPDWKPDLNLQEHH